MAKYVIYHSICLILLLWYLKLEDYEWARVGQTRNAHKILVGMKKRYKYNTKLDLIQMGLRMDS